MYIQLINHHGRQQSGEKIEKRPKKTTTEKGSDVTYTSLQNSNTETLHFRPTITLLRHFAPVFILTNKSKLEIRKAENSENGISSSFLFSGLSFLKCTYQTAFRVRDKLPYFIE